MAEDELHELVDALPESEIQPARRFLEFLLQRVQRQHLLDAFENAPEEAAEPTEKELKAIKEGERDLALGRVEPYEVAIKSLKR